MTKKKREKIRYDGAVLWGIFPYLIMVCIALMYTICRSHVVICSIVMSLMCCGVYMAMFWCVKKPWGSVAITLIMLLMCSGAVGVVGMAFMDFTGRAGGGGSDAFAEGGFVHFLFTASLTFDPIYAVAAMILFSVIIGVAACYFSAVLPRVSFLMLPLFIPIILCARTGGGLPVWIQIAVFGTFIMSAICSARRCESSDTLVFVEKGNWHGIVAAVCAAVAASAVAAAIPKDNETLLKEYVDSFLGSGVGFSQGGNTLTNFATSSSVNRGGNELPDDLLFTVQTDVPTYIDRWAFDWYNGAEGWSLMQENDNMGYPDWRSSATVRRVPTLIALLKNGVQEGKLEEYSELLDALPYTDTRSGYMYIKVMDGSSTRVVLHPLGTYSVDIHDYSGRLYHTKSVELFTEYDIESPQYLVRYAADRPVAEYVAALKDVDLEQLLFDACEESVIDGAMANAFIEEYRLARSYQKTFGTQGVSPEIAELAQEITAGLDNDYEKALAIERWFGEQEFVYDLRFIPMEVSAEYFLFDSHRGICSDYATAFTLLARGAGLTARYVEGFSLSEDSKDERGIYNVTGADAHAYTQVYIKGCGWVNFDATLYAIPAEDMLPPWVMVLIIVLAACAVAALVIMIFAKPLGYAWFIVTYPVRNSRVCVRRVALYARELAGRISGKAELSLSMGETEEILSAALDMPCEAAEIRAAADALMYSDGEVSCDKQRLLEDLKKLRRQRRRLGK